MNNLQLSRKIVSMRLSLVHSFNGFKALRAAMFVTGVLVVCGMASSVQAADEGAAHAKADTAETGHAATEAGIADAESADHNKSGHGSGHAEEYSLFSDLPFWSAIAFIGFVLAIKALGLWDHLLDSMSVREKAEIEAIVIAETDLSEARAMLRSSKGRMEALDEQIRAIMEEAARDAESTRHLIITAAENEARESVERARHEIERVRDQSLDDIFETLANRVTDITEERLKQGLQSEDHNRLIGATLEQLEIR